MSIQNRIRTLAEAIHPEVVAARRHLHQHPELSFQEVNTGRYIADRLEAMGLQPEHGWAGNGVVCRIQGRQPGNKVVALRADIDALPIQEANKVSYCSANEGIMHACGHDVHTASLLGVARILHDLRDAFAGTVQLIFQPGEEQLPGGASIMIREGVLENPKPATILGQHVHPPLEVGLIGMRAGRYMASCDELFVTVKGKGGHGALPHDCIDPVAMTAQMIVALQQVVSRYADPTLPSVLTFGKINTLGGATNVIPNEVKLEGTFRTMDERWRFEAHSRMRSIAENLIKGMGGAVDFRIEVGYPALINEPQLTHLIQQKAVAYLGADKVHELPIRMTAEDFSFYSQVIPACFYRLGTGNPSRGITAPIHTDTFDVDEDCLVTSTGLMSWLALSQLDA